MVDGRGSTDWIKSVGNGQSMKVIVSRDELPIAGLRNLSASLASGDALMVWDDDDLYHPRRIEDQLCHLIDTGAEAGYLGDTVHYFEDTQKANLVHWDVGMPSTLICKRNSMPSYKSPSQTEERGSDAEVQGILMASEKASVLFGKPHLYVRTFHGRNVWPRDHHESIVSSYGAPVTTGPISSELAKFAPQVIGKLS